jgi:hypothetical protein
MVAVQPGRVRVSRAVNLSPDDHQSQRIPLKLVLLKVRGVNLVVI